MSKNGYVNAQVLVETGWAEEHLEDASLRFVEVDVDTTAYNSGHIPGAVGWNWKQDTQDALVRDIPNREKFEALLGSSGISPDTTVILYGDNNNWFATFAFWLLKYYGHDDVRLINGGRVKWVAESRPLTTQAPAVQPRVYRVSQSYPELRALRDIVNQGVGNAGVALVDVRSPKEFSGELLAPENIPQEGAQRGGHIPGAANIPWGTAVDGDGTFKSYDELLSIYGGKGVTPDKEVIALLPHR